MQKKKKENAHNLYLKEYNVSCIVIPMYYVNNWRRKWLPAPLFLPGKSHGERSLVGYSPWGHKSQT